MSNIPTNPLIALFTDRLAYLGQLEKVVAKRYQKLEKVAQTHELTKCLSPVSTDQEAHFKRITLIKDVLNIKSLPPHTVKIEEYKLKKSSIEQDLAIVAEALHLQNLKLAIYELLHPIAMALELPAVPDLIEQTITDNRNTNTWLRQIIHNIIGPALQQEK